MVKLVSMLAVFFMLGFANSFAQTGSTVQILPVDGYSPIVYFGEYLNSYYDERRDRIYFHSKDTLHMWDMSEKKWTMLRTTRFEDSQFVMDIDTLNNRVLIWSGGAGLVYTTDVDWKADPVRIDKSFNHRNQYEHGHLISPKDGSINLYGGYGFWQDKDIFTQFDDASGQWDLVVWKGDKWPSKRIFPALNYWRKENKIVLIGGRVSSEPEKPYVTFRNSIFDIWTFDPVQEIWDHHGDLAFKYDALVSNYLMLGFIVTPRNGLLQDENLLIGMDQFNSNDRNSIMYAIDLETMQGSFIDVQTGALSKFERLIAYFLNEKTRQIYLIWTPLPTNNKAAPLYVSTIDLPPADSIRANIQRMVALANNNWQEPQESTSTMYLVPLLLIGVAAPFFYWRHNRRSKKRTSDSQALEFDLATNSLQDKINILGTNAGTAIVHNGNDITNNFSNDEIDLFLLLAKQYQSKNKYISTEQIEQAIWESGTNPDYSRKMRNQVQRKLEDNLQLVLPKRDDSLWLLSRSEPSDKRRKEYALNPEPYKIEFYLED
jgi:hypothetical protein